MSLHVRSPRSPLALVLLALGACAAPQPQKPHYDPPRPAPPVVQDPAPAPKDPEAEPVAAQSAEDQDDATSGAAAQSDPAAAAAHRAAAGTLAIVDGRPVPVTDILELWLHRESREVYDYLRTVIERRVIEAEARRMGIALEPALVDAAVADARADIEELIAERMPEGTFDDYVTRRLGLHPERYLEVLRKNQGHSLLYERVVRGWQLCQERASIRAILISKDDSSADVQAALDSGRPFADVAREFSRDPSKEQGGAMTPIVRTEKLLLSRLAFATPEGSFTGPVENDDTVLWVYVEDFPEPLRGTWSEISAEVEASLAQKGIDDSEIVQWQNAIMPFHVIDDRPFLELFGEPLED